MSDLTGKLKTTQCQAMLLAIRGPYCYNDSSVIDFQRLTQSQQYELDALLATYQQFFKEPTTLPPKRIYDHKISLLNDKPFCLKPYRYPHAQKEEIER